MTMSLIQTVTVGVGGAESIQFTSIPQDGTDLLVLASLRSTHNVSAAQVVYFLPAFSGSSGRRVLKAIDTTVSSGTTLASLAAAVPVAQSRSLVFGNTSLYIANYSINSRRKTGHLANTATLNSTSNHSGMDTYHFTTDAITSFLINLPTGSLAQGSTVSLYKITKGSDGITTVS